LIRGEKYMNKLEGKVEVITAAVKQIGKNVNGVQGDVSNLADLDRSPQVILLLDKVTLQYIF
jgi:hypothetical protein